MQVVIGAFVASLKGGLVYNTWPTMNGALIPDDLFALEPWYHNPFENPVMAQFVHRLVAYTVVLAVAVEAWRTFRLDAGGEQVERRASALLMVAAVLGQAALGIWTLLEAVPITLGIAHQGLRSDPAHRRHAPPAHRVSSGQSVAPAKASARFTRRALIPDVAAATRASWPRTLRSRRRP